jgi:hypothetical protein
MGTQQIISASTAGKHHAICYHSAKTETTFRARKKILSRLAISCPSPSDFARYRIAAERYRQSKRMSSDKCTFFSQSRETGDNGSIAWLTSAGQSVMRQLQGRRSMTRRRSRLQTVRLRRLKKSVEGFGHFVRQFLIFGFALEAQIVACAFDRDQFCAGWNQLQG